MFVSGISLLGPPFKVTHGTTATSKKGQESDSTNWNDIAVVQSSMCSTWSSASSTVFSWSLQGGNTCTKTSHDTAVASYLQCCPYRQHPRQTRALLRVGPNERREVQPTVCFLVLSWKSRQCSIAKKATKIPNLLSPGSPFPRRDSNACHQQVSLYHLTLVGVKRS